MQGLFSLIAHAQEAAPLPTAPGVLIQNLYTYLLFVSGFLAVGAIVWGAIIYVSAAGNPGKQKDGREWIEEALKGLLLLFAAALLLRTVNPELLNLNVMEFAGLKNLELQNGAVDRGALTCLFSSSQPGCGTQTARCDSPPPNTPACTWTDLGPQQCQPLTHGDASIEALEDARCFGGNEREASGIAHAESGGVATLGSGVDKCLGDGQVVSWGLFQINISSNRVGGLDCPRAFSAPYTGSNKNCRVTDQALYTKCVEAAKDPRLNIEAACKISGGGRSWAAWGANEKCGF